MIAGVNRLHNVFLHGLVISKKKIGFAPFLCQFGPLKKISLSFLHFDCFDFILAISQKETKKRNENLLSAYD